MEPTQLLKGALDAAVLAVVGEGDGYGYDLVRRLREAGLNEVAEASVYGTLRRLYRAGALTTYLQPSEEGPSRRYYGLTDSGRAALSEARRAWIDFSRTLDRILGTEREAIVR